MVKKTRTWTSQVKVFPGSSGMFSEVNVYCLLDQHPFYWRPAFPLTLIVGINSGTYSRQGLSFPFQGVADLGWEVPGCLITFLTGAINPGAMGGQVLPSIPSKQSWGETTGDQTSKQKYKKKTDKTIIANLYGQE